MKKMIDKKLDEINVMFFHGQTTDGYRFTVAGLFENGGLSLGISICSKYDIFCKSKGRNISSGRLLNQRPSIPGKIILVETKRKDFTYFNETVSEFNTYSKRDLIKIFNLRKNDIPF